MTAPARNAGAVLFGKPRTRDNIIKALRRYAELYGPEFTQAAFSPSTARWRDNSEELIDRYRMGDPETGEAWPSLNGIKAPFGGSFNAAREAAGFEPNRPGPGPRRKDGTAAPRRSDPTTPTRTIIQEKPDSILVRERDAERARAERAEARLARLRNEKAVGAPMRAKDRARLREAREGRDAAKAELRLANRALRASERESADAAVVAEALAGDLSRERSRRMAAEDSYDRKVREVEALRARPPEAVSVPGETLEVEVVREVEIEVERVVYRDAPEQEAIDAAMAERAEALERMAVAERAVAAAAARESEIVALWKGEARPLTREELRELRDGRGAVGPAPLAAALKELALARAYQEPGRLRVALSAVAAAAVRWRQRL